MKLKKLIFLSLLVMILGTPMIFSGCAHKQSPKQFLENTPAVQAKVILFNLAKKDSGLFNAYFYDCEVIAPPPAVQNFILSGQPQTANYNLYENCYEVYNLNQSKNNKSTNGTWVAPPPPPKSLDLY